MNNIQILVLDFGSQYTQLIARRLREYGIYTEIVPYFESLDSIKAKNPKGIILSGGPASVYEEGAYKPNSGIFDLGIPILGICYGMQYIAHFFGGQVVRAEAQEFGKALLEIVEKAESLNIQVLDDDYNKSTQALDENARSTQILNNNCNTLSTQDRQKIDEPKVILKNHKALNTQAYIQDNISNEVLSTDSNTISSRHTSNIQYENIQNNKSYLSSQEQMPQSSYTSKIDNKADNKNPFLQSETTHSTHSTQSNPPHNTQNLQSKNPTATQATKIIHTPQSPHFTFTTISTTKERQNLYHLWEEFFSTSHSFMSKELLATIKTDMNERISQVKELIGISYQDNLIAFGTYSKSEFYCFRLSESVVYREILRAFLSHLLESKDFKNLTTQWDKYDKNHLQNYYNLGFEKIATNDTMLTLSIKKHTLLKALQPQISQDSSLSKISFHTFSHQKFPQMLHALIDLWEDSVKASHHFLSKQDIIELKEEVKEGLKTCEAVIVASNEKDFLGFIAGQNNKIEMLFVAQKYFKQGIGKKLVYQACVRYLQEYDEMLVDCNTENESALQFYTKLGFQRLSQSKTDSKGRDFPITHLSAKVASLQKLLCEPVLETERTYLRHVHRADFEALHSIFSKAKVMYAWGHGFSKEESREWLSRQFQSYREHGFGLYAIIDKASGKIIGDAGFNLEPISLDGKSTKEIIEIGYILDESVWGRGIASEVVESLKQYAFSNFGVSEVYALIKEDNFASMRVARRVGMKIIGENIKHYKGKDLRHYLFHADSKEADSSRVDSNKIDSSELVFEVKKPSSSFVSEYILFNNVKQNSIVWMSHADKVERIPDGFIELARSENTQNCAIANIERQIYALQFHPEVVHSECGGEILKNFAVHICKANTNWNMKNFAESEIVRLRERVLGGKSINEEQREAKNDSIESSTTPINLQTTPIETKNLILRPFNERDIEALYHIYRDEKCNEFLPWFACKSLEEASYIFKHKYQQAYEAQKAYYAICLKDNIPIGYVHIENTPPYDMGYALLPSFWGRGIAKEAVLAIIESLKGKIPYLSATHDRLNVRSKNLLNSLGMCYQYAYKELWQPKNKEVIFCFYQLNFRHNAPIYQGYAEKYELVENPTPKCCPWACAKDSEGDRIYKAYHDTEWGEPMHEDNKLFEMLVLEGFQAGLSWITILKKREAFRAAFDGFNPHIVAEYDEAKVESLLNNEGIIRNRAKIEAAINNAKCFLEIQKEFGSFDSFIWGYVGHKPIYNHPKSMEEIEASSALSDRISKDLQKRGFKFVGSTSVYAFMQSIGMVNDHLSSCFKGHVALSNTGGNLPLDSLAKPYAKANKVLCAVSGGVDSSVVATLLYRAIKENLIPVFVDTGLLRKGEREAVEAMFRDNLQVPLISVDASELFLSRLKGVTDPEKKRKIIGESFIEVFEAEAKKHNVNGEIKFLAQGTLYPDVIESVSVKGPSKTIKSHHNVGGLPEWMKFELIEPLRELFKDEVRALGRELGMPESMLMRHPFPGPGLAIRIMGEVNKADLELLREADSIFIEELHKAGLYDKVWQAFCVLLNVKSVGVMGDNRTYDNTICVRAVEAIDGMTATFAHLPHDFLESVSNRIINEVEGINRVVFDITSKPPGTIEWE